jgi:hypothetical protein
VKDFFIWEEDASFFGMEEALLLALVSSASRNGAAEKLRNWHAGKCLYGHRGFRLAVVLRVTWSMALLRHRVAPVISTVLSMLWSVFEASIESKLQAWWIWYNYAKFLALGQALPPCLLDQLLPPSTYQHTFEDVQYQDMTGEPGTKHETTRRLAKVCFVTIGATASFDRLLKAVLERSFLQALHDARYTDLLIQYGKEGGKAIYDGFVTTECDDAKQNLGIEITGFDFNAGGLGQEMRKAKGNPKNGSEEGLVISHAGAIFPILSGWA